MMSETFTSEALDLQTKEVVTKNGVRKVVPALHIGFAKSKVFIPYDIPPPVTVEQQEAEKGSPHINAELEEWLEKMEMFEEDLKWLLRLPHQKFWCQVVYDKQLDYSLKSYLSKAPRFYDLHSFLINTAMSDVIQRVHKLVFKIFIRMATYKESKDSHFTQQGFADIIYDKYLFDIPKIMDLCTLYINSNQKLLQKMVENIFKVQPCYNDDLEKAAEVILQAFNTIEDKLGLLAHEDISAATSGPKKLSETNALHSLNHLKWTELQDIIMYLVDVAVSLGSFLEVYPPANTAFHALSGECRIAAFYDVVFPPLEQELTARSRDKQLYLVISEVKKRIILAKVTLIKTFHNMIFSCCIQPLLEMADIQNSGSCAHVDELLHIMSTIVSDKSFICRYNKEFPFEDIIDVLSQLNIAPDGTQIDYIQSAFSASTSTTVPLHAAQQTKKKLQQEKITDEIPFANGGTDFVPLEGATAGPIIQGTELESLITHVQDLLPDLSSGFVESCLEYFNYDAEKVISGILDDSLPAALKNLDRKMNRVTKSDSVLKETLHPETEPPGGNEQNLLSERKNVFDNDEFDVFSRNDIDTSRIHKGKREKTVESLAETEDDLQLVKAVCNRYDITATTYDDPMVYDDEYDDTYDELSVGLEEPREEDEFEKQRPFTTPRVLMTREEINDDIEPKPATSRESEVQNLRDGDKARSSTEPSRHSFHRPSFDVKGKAKGQGQDAKTLHNRSQKEKQKSTYANHNRKAQADRKRNQGMLHF